MIWHLIAAVFAGLGAAGVALLLRKLSRNRLPKWIIPAFAGAAMLAFQLGIEYSWVNTKQDQLPEGSVIISTQESRYFWRPWTYLAPMTTGFTVLDSAQIQRSGALAEFYLYHFERAYVDLLEVERYQLNCQDGALIPFNANQEPRPQAVSYLAEANPLRLAICPTH